MQSAPRHANILLLLLVSAVTINYLDRGALSVAAPRIAQDLLISPTQMGALFSAFFWTYSSFQLLAGWLVDRYPLKYLYAAGFLLWSLATAAVGLTGNFPQLLAARLLLGIGESIAYPASSKIIVQYFPEQRRGFANALVDAGSKLGPGLSTLLGALALSSFGWRGLFLIAGIGSLFWLIPWFWLSTPRASSEAAPAETASPSPSWAQLLRCRQLWGASAGMFSLGYVLYFLLSWLPTYLMQERGASLSSLAALGSAPFLAMAAASLAGGWISDRRIAAGWDAGKTRRAFAVSGLMLCALAILPAPVVSNPAVCVALLTVACGCLGLFTSNVWAISQTLAGPAAAGRWTGVQNAVGNLGGVVSPLVTGWIVSQTGSFALAFTTAAVVLAAGAAVYLLSLGTIQPVSWTNLYANSYRSSRF